MTEFQPIIFFGFSKSFVQSFEAVFLDFVLMAKLNGFG